jgi:hypothetical protein
MTDYVIPCETFVRLTAVLRHMPKNADHWFNSVRIDNGIALCCNRRLLVMEAIGGPSGVIHIRADPVIIDQCRTEAPFGSTLTITAIPELGISNAVTTLGASWANILVTGPGAPTDYDRWRSVVERARTPAPAPRGGMFWDTDEIRNIGDASPSGRLVFEQVIDVSRPTLIRDVTDYNWLGVFNPDDDGHNFPPATLPTWVR